MRRKWHRWLAGGAEVVSNIQLSPLRLLRFSVNFRIFGKIGKNNEPK